jgi:hypothetical protein
MTSFLTGALAAAAFAVAAYFVYDFAAISMVERNEDLSVKVYDQELYMEASE